MMGSFLSKGCPANLCVRLFCQVHVVSRSKTRNKMDKKTHGVSQLFSPKQVPPLPSEDNLLEEMESSLNLPW